MQHERVWDATSQDTPALDTVSLTTTRLSSTFTLFHHGGSNPLEIKVLFMVIVVITINITSSIASHAMP